MDSAQHTPTRSLGAELERARLEHRARRLMVAIVSLRQLASESARERRATPKHLNHTLVDFEAQIDATSARLRVLAGQGSSELIERLDRVR
jgi:hypothetical protein